MISGMRNLRRMAARRPEPGELLYVLAGAALTAHPVGTWERVNFRGSGLSGRSLQASEDGSFVAVTFGHETLLLNAKDLTNIHGIGFDASAPQQFVAGGIHEAAGLWAYRWGNASLNSNGGFHLRELHDPYDQLTAPSAASPWGGGDAGNISFSPDGSMMAVPRMGVFETGTGNRVTGSPVFSQNLGGRCAVFSPSGEVLLAGGQVTGSSGTYLFRAYTVADWSIRYQSAPAAMRGSGLIDVAFIPSTDLAAIASPTGNRVYIIDVPTGALHHTLQSAELGLQLGGTVASLATNGNGTLLAVGTDRSPYVYVFRTSDWQAVDTSNLTVTGIPHRLAFALDFYRLGQ